MSKKREEYGPTLQEKKVPTPNRDYHKGRKKRSKGPYVVIASSFKFGNLPSYFFVLTEQGAQANKRQIYWASFEIYGEGENWTEKEAKEWCRFLEKEYKNANTRRRL
jgi:hypothetical protein